MKIWLTTCVLLFVLVELVLWVKQFILPLPVYLVAGAFLAIASNYEKAKLLLPTSTKDQEN
jgi:hypothetical protein